ncbi:MAG: thioesterase family protein [Actinomycetota bacterium]
MIPTGTSASIPLLVEDPDTAIALGSGDVAVLGTPRIVALCEEAAVAALAGHVPEGSTSVGTNVNLAHLAPTPVGGSVVARAIVTSADGRRVDFDIEVHDGDTLAARGTHTRAIVDRSRFGA